MVLLQTGSFCPEILANLLVPATLIPAADREHYFQSEEKIKFRNTEKAYVKNTYHIRDCNNFNTDIYYP